MNLLRNASKISSLPILNKFAPTKVASKSEQAQYLKCQRLALSGAEEIASLLQPGWTEKKAAKLFETYLRDHGVDAFFHFPFAWWGDRTRFDGVQNYYGYLPSSRVLQENEPFILDVAPILEGYIADIGYSGFLGEPTETWKESKAFLAELYELIPEIVRKAKEGADAWNEIDALITERGFDNIHAKYPFSVLGHRVHKAPSKIGQLKFIHFGWQSYWAFTSRGIFGQLLNQNFVGELDGLWAIEPHIGSSGFGAKFEEILVVDGENIYWLEQGETRS